MRPSPPARQSHSGGRLQWGLPSLEVYGKGVENSTLVEVIDYYCSRLKLSALFHNYSDVFNAKSTPVFARR